MEKQWKLIHREELLQQLADQLQQLEKSQPRVSIGCLEVRLTIEGAVLLECSVSHFLDCVVNDLHWDDNGDWSFARDLELRVL